MIVVIGNLSWDKLIEVECLPLPNQDVLILNAGKFPGGAAGNVAAILALLGQQVALLACIGNDKEGDELVHEIASYGVDTHPLCRSDAQTSEFLVVMDKQGNRSFFINPSEASFQLTITDFHNLDLSVIDGIIFVGCRLELAHSIVDQIKSTQIRIFANIGFWASSGELTGEHIDFLSDIDFVFLNQDEFKMLSENIKVFLKSPDFLTGIRQLIVTNGAEETTIYTSSTSEVCRPSPLQSMVNTLGCGDAFMGAYIANLLTGASTRECCEAGHRYARKVALLRHERSSLLKN